MSGNGRSSLVWKYFEISSVDTTRASCKICKSYLSRGGTGRKTAFNTSNLLKHLRVNHDDEWQQYKIDDKRKPLAVPTTSTSSANAACNKRIAQIAQRYLAAPSTSVASERLFSCAGDIYSDSRCSLAPERAEMLLFIRNNMRLFS